MIKHFLRLRAIFIVSAAILLSVATVKAATNIGDNIFTDGSISGNFLGTWDGYATNTLPYLSSSDLSSASSTQIKSFWATPSTRIAAGTNLSWSGNTLNASGGSTSQWTVSGNNIYNNNSGAVSIGGSSSSTAAFYSDPAKNINYLSNLNVSGTANVGYSSITNVYEMGDSLTMAGALVPYSTRLQSLLGSYYKADGLHNNGVSAQNTAQMLARFRHNIVNQDADYVIIMGGINDIQLYGYSSSTVEDNLQAMYTAAHNAEIKVVAITILPSSNNNATQKKKVTDINTWIKNNATGVDFVVDGYAHFVDPGNPGVLNPTYDVGDGTHLNQNGYDELGNFVYSSVSWSRKSISFNQSLRKVDTPEFGGVNISAKQGGYQINNERVLYASTTLFNYNVGYYNPVSSPTGSQNNSFGYAAGYSITNGSGNNAHGYQSLFNNMSGSLNDAYGDSSMRNNQSGSFNSGYGGGAIFYNVSGNFNTAHGFNSLAHVLGDRNVGVGAYSGNYETGSNSFYVNNIDESNTDNDKAYSLLYGNFSGVAGSLTGQQLTVNGQFNVNGKVAIGTTTAPNLLSVKAQTGTSTIEVGTNAKTASCLVFEDTDKAGFTYCTFLNGVMTCSQNDCSN